MGNFILIVNNFGVKNFVNKKLISKFALLNNQNKTILKTMLKRISCWSLKVAPQLTFLLIQNKRELKLINNTLTKN